MFCVAALIVLAIISIFSARYRRYVKKAWGCTARRLTFRPCDTSFKDDIKNKLLSPVAIKTPRLVKAADIALEIAAFLIIVLTVWSLYVVAKSGLNLYVYGTCNPSNAASCSLGSEACSIETATPSFVTSVKEFKVHEWIGNEFSSLGDTITAIPTRMQDWDAKEYVPEAATYWKPYDSSKPTAVEIIDPGCQFCKELYMNQKAAGFANRYNLTYIAYPIKDTTQSSGYKFSRSLLVTQYLEAMRRLPLEDTRIPADWYVLQQIFEGKNEDGFDNQIVINGILTEKETIRQLETWMQEAGYSEEQIKEVRQIAGSDKIQRAIEKNRTIVEDEVKTVKIPTMIFDGRRQDGAITVENLR